MMEQTHSMTLANSACIHIHAIKYEYACGIFVCLFVLFCFVCLFFWGGEGGGGGGGGLMRLLKTQMLTWSTARINVR